MTPGTSAGGLTPFDEDTLWATVVGQEAAVTLLRTAAGSPVHAYLLVGHPVRGEVKLPEPLPGPCSPPVCRTGQIRRRLLATDVCPP